MAITINGSGTITGISAGGLPDGSVTADDIAAAAVTDAKIASGVSASKLTGTLPALDGSSLTGITSGATDLDVWRLTSNVNLNTSGVDTILKTNWVRASGGFNVLGSGMSLNTSTGYWTFPSTGYWEVSFSYNVQVVENYQSVRGFIYFNNGSTYIMAEARAQIHGVSAQYRQASVSTIIDVTNASTDYMFLDCINSGSSTSYVRGGTNDWITFVTFKKLGDT